MIINNELVSESFSFIKTGRKITSRGNEIERLDELTEFCNRINETVCYDEKLFEIEVDDNVLMYEFLYINKGNDLQAYVSDIINKCCKKRKKSEEADATILCSCGEYDNAVGNLTDYAQCRQEYLKKMEKCQEYVNFMRTCFPNSIFSDECNQEFAYIKDFAEHVEEITMCLSILDKMAVPLYEEHKTDLKTAMAVLKAILGRSCSLDPDHKTFLNFPFSYETEVDGKMIQKEKVVECKPHLKLVRDDSDLRIYFYWKDDEIEKGKKVLIGRVGRHPWKK